MRLSLRTLLAFEDNIFDTEHRLQLERTIPKHGNAVETLRRLRTVVRNPRLGVPGVVDQREELDPNIVAEYLDHQLAAEHLDKFETYCLSSDTFLAEVASVHQILSNVLGEPARTSRDCRLRCYDIGRFRPELTTLAESSPPTKTFPDRYFSLFPEASSETHAQPLQSNQNNSKPSSRPQRIAWLLLLLLCVGLGSFLYWQKIHKDKKDKASGQRQAAQIPVEPEPPKPEAPKPEPPRKEPAKPEPPKTEPPKKEPPKPEPPKPEPPKKEAPKPEPPKKESPKPEPPKKEPPKKEPPKPEPPKKEPSKPEPPKPEPPKKEPPKSVAVPSSATAEDAGAVPADPFLNSTPERVGELPGSFASVPPPVESSTWTSDPQTRPPSDTSILEAGSKASPLREGGVETASADGALLFDDTVKVEEPVREVFRQSPIAERAAGAPPPAPTPIEFPERPRIALHQRAVERSAEVIPSTVWQTTASAATPTADVVHAQDIWGNPSSLRYPIPKYSEIRSTGYETASTSPSDQTLTTVTFGESVPFVAESGKTPVPASRSVMGQLIDSSEPLVLFTAPSANEQWKKSNGRVELQVDQYLLTLAPFRANLELGGQFRIEMVGDAKICVLAPDAQGNPGIFVDYGRIVIRPLSNQPKSLRIQTEKTSGLATLGGRSLIFVDTFAEIVPTVPKPNVPLANAAVKNNAILGLLPDPAETVSWLAEDQGRPYTTNAQTSVLLETGRSDRGAIRNLPNWLQSAPLSEEGRMLAVATKRAFEETKGNCEAALERISRDPAIPIRAFGHRLWGDLGRFDVPLQLLARNTVEDESVRQILANYFTEVMKRDAETVQRLADAIDTVRR